MIVSSAILKDGVIYTGKRHNDILCDKNRPFGFLKLAEQGFITDQGIFLNRKEALQHAIDCGQLKKETVFNYLFSEDLW